MFITRVLKVALVAVLILAVGGTAYWGYQEHQDKNSMLIKAENSYQRAFHDLNNNISNMEDELGKSLATNSRDMLAPCLANTWRIAHEANSNIGQLPLNLTPFNKTEQFLAEVGDFTYDIGMRDLENEPLTDEEWNELQTLHDQSRDIQQDLQRIQHEVLDGELRWMDVELAVAAEDADVDPTLMNGIEEIDKKAEGYVESEPDAPHNKISTQFDDVEEQIDGSAISEQEAVQKAQQFLDRDDLEDVEVSQNGEGREFSSYTVRFEVEDRDDVIAVDVTSNGGHVVQALDSRDVEDTEIGLHDGQLEAEEFLEQRDMTSMVAVESDQYDNVGVYDFVYAEDEVRLYTDAVRVKVALDNGEVIGFEGLDYIVNHDDNRDIPEPELTMEEAQEDLNGHFEVMEEHLSVIEVEAGEEELCYEFLGTVENDTYRIFVNAQTGKEEKLEKMKQTQPAF